MRRFWPRLVLCLLAATVLTGQSRLRLKATPGRGEGAVVGSAKGGSTVRNWSADRRHVLAEFEDETGFAAAQNAADPGIRLVQYVPDLGYILSIARDFDIDGMAGVKATRIRAEDKISPALREDGVLATQTELMVEFFPDVESEAARAIAASTGFEAVEHSGLLGNHLLVRGRPEEARKLAEWDEVAYVFPASAELRAGETVVACPGALTELGLVGQYVASIGDGWDGAGRGHAQLGYYFQTLTEKLPAEQVRAEVQRALAEWSRVAALTFTPAASAGSTRTVNILFGGGSHGDPYPFDGQGSVLAHTFYPAPPNPESIAGDMHLDGDEEWVAGTELTARSVDLYSVSLHELGHTLGLGHSDVPGSVMYPYYRRAATLTPVDVNAILALYAAAGASNPAGSTPLALAIGAPSSFPATTQAASVALAGTATGGTGDVSVTWSSDRTGAGVAVGGRNWTIASLPLQLGSNAITVTATDAKAARVSQTALVIREAAAAAPAVSITSPTTAATYSTGASSVTVMGLASSASGIARVQWTNSRGGSGIASGTTQWSTGPVALQAGANLLTLTAFDAAGGTASRTLTVTRTLSSDTTAPTLKITSPVSTSVLTSSSAIRFTGTATDNVAVTAVAWSTSAGASGTASGTAYWTAAGIPLLIGTNVVIVRASDAAGNTNWRSVTVTRR